jgi:maltose alpha-D-glucosyltransferase/alpha-amylase
MISSDYWYKNAIIYTLDVERFADGNGDGKGDFQGLTQRLDYLASLGITCLWLLPFYPSPERDEGYDVSDYYGVNPDYGSLGHFVEFMREARERGIRVIIDLVANHTSDQHPWFQSARSDPRSPYRQYYVWDEDPEHHAEPVFPGEQDRTWTYDEKAGAYYLHHFYPFQPDLNVDNPVVRDEILRIMGFWLELGVSGFRVDAVPFLVEDTSLRAARGGGEPPRFEFLSRMRELLDNRKGDAVLLAEANVPPDRLHKYFEHGERFHMLFDFVLNQHLFLAMAREQAAPLAEALRQVPKMPWRCQWTHFIRNHDELTLDRLPDKDREEIFAAFGPDPDMQIFGRGIRRRLPPMLGGDWRRVKLAYSLLLTLPGTPIIRYGEEIGMGDDLSLPGRTSVRTAMQWAPGRNGGFSAAPADHVKSPIIRGGPFGYEQVNVARQQADPDSLLNWFERAIRTRKYCAELGYGECTVIETGSPHVFAHRVSSRDAAVVVVHNLAGRPCEVTVDLQPYGNGMLIDLLGDRQYRPIEPDDHRVKLEPYGFRWLRIGDGDAVAI